MVLRWKVTIESRLLLVLIGEPIIMPCSSHGGKYSAWYLFPHWNMQLMACFVHHRHSLYHWDYLKRCLFSSKRRKGSRTSHIKEWVPQLLTLLRSRSRVPLRQDEKPRCLIGLSWLGWFHVIGQWWQHTRFGPCSQTELTGCAGSGAWISSGYKIGRRGFWITLT